MGVNKKYKVTYGELLKEYVTNYESTGKLFSLNKKTRDFELSEDSKFGHKMNLVSFRLQWQLVGRNIARSLPRKKKKRLARLCKLKYTRLQKRISAMEI